MNYGKHDINTVYILIYFNSILANLFTFIIAINGVMGAVQQGFFRNITNILHLYQYMTMRRAWS